MRVADYIMSRLYSEGVKQVFLVTGRGALFLTDALAKYSPLESVCLHHEQSAAFAAVASAQQSNKIGACLVSTGCAATNAMTGVLSAWQDGVPCIFISGQNTLRETTRYTGIPLRTYGQQEADIISLVKPITKYACMVTSPDEIINELNIALMLANSGRKGPVWLDIPLDIQSALIDPEKLNHLLPPSGNQVAKIAPNLIEYVAKSLAQAVRPVVLIGHGVRSAGAEEALRSFVDNWQVPCTFTASAPDIFGSANSLSIGSVGSMGCSRAGNFAVQNSDFLLVLGSRLTSLTTGTDFCKFAREAKVVVVDIDPVEHSKDSVTLDHLIVGDLKDFLDQINRLEVSRTNGAWLNKCQHWKSLFSPIEGEFQSGDAIDLYELASCLSLTLPSQSNIVTDSGLVEVILPTNIHFSDGMRCIHPASQGAMGYALPAAIGAYYVSKKPTIAVIGDGSIMMNLQELETIRHKKLPIKILIINNNVYSIIRRRQRDLFRRRTIGTDPENGVSCPDFSKVAACFDFPYRRISDPGSLASDLHEVLSAEGPVICEIMGKPDQSYIEIGQCRSELDRRLVRRPLEDQSPFLDRKMFLSEMIIDPIDQ